MKHSSTEHADSTRRPTVAMRLLSLALVAAALAVGNGLALAEGGGTPPAEQGLSDPGAKRSQAMNSPGVYPTPGVTHAQPPRANSVNRNNGSRNTSNRNTYNNQRSQQYYGSRTYSNNRHGSYAYVDPGYYYAPPYYGPPPVYYEPYPTPGISLFFGF